MSFWEEEFGFRMTGEEVRVIWTGAVRYALPRGTFASQWTAQEVLRHARGLDRGTLGIIVRDIEFEVDRAREMREDGASYAPDVEPFERVLPELRKALMEKEARMSAVAYVKCDGDGCGRVHPDHYDEDYIRFREGWARVTVGSEEYDLCPECAAKVLGAVGIEAGGER